MFGDAVYHSAVNFTTLGYGDIVMSGKHKLLGPLEAINGVLMIEVSTAALMASFQDAMKKNHPGAAEKTRPGFFIQPLTGCPFLSVVVKGDTMKIFNILSTGTVITVFFVCPVWADGPGDALKGAYRIDGQMVQLVNGRAESEVAPGSAIKMITIVVGKPVYGDLVGGGDDDTALFLSQDPGGSGTFFYVASAITYDGCWQGTHAVFIGDRVALEIIRIRKGVVTARYADRRPDQSIAETPEVSKTIYLKLLK